MHGEAAYELASARWLVWCGRGTGGNRLPPTVRWGYENLSQTFLGAAHVALDLSQTA